jgi:hypothetical protein
MTMATTTNITVDDRNLTNALRALSKVTGASFRNVIRYETGKIMESAVKKTRAAQVQLIQKNARAAKVRTLRNGKTYFMHWKMPDTVWAAVQRQISNSIKRRKAARGLSKKSWKQVAASLGITISVPAYVSKATTGGKDYPANATARENKSGNQFFISGKNERTYDPTIVKAIRSAMGARLSYFRRNLKNGVFKTARETAARYPGLR